MKAYIWMLGTLLSFSLMAVAARELSSEIHTFQMLLFRSIIGLLVVAFIIIKTRQFNLVKSQRLQLHALRNSFHFLGQFGWFIGIILLPLADVFALEFTAPLWTILIAAIFLNEGITKTKVISLLLALVGVILIVKPSSQLFNPVSLIVLFAAFCYAVAYVSTKALTSTEHVLTILFLMNLMQLPLALPFSIYYWVTPDLLQFTWLIVIGITALSAHYCITHAMKVADASTVVMLDFLRLPLIILIGIIFYQEPLSIMLLVGAGLMLLGNLLNILTPVKLNNVTPMNKIG
ncbi:MAG: drug/metabolite transporter (DMT)-like permease [Crocinitomicaceae bacterium]|jgi:drug/metabolite transporter (DMT)-like permease